MTPQTHFSPVDLVIAPVPPCPAPTRPRHLPESAYDVAPLGDDRAARRRQLVASLLGSPVKPETAEWLAAPHFGTYYSFKPRNGWEDWLSGQAANLTFAIDRNQRIERRLRDLAALRAIDCWEVDQALLAERTAAQLAGKPGETHAALWTTLAGCDWLLARWAELATDDIGGWTGAQRTLAHQIYPFEPDRMCRPGVIADHVARLHDQRERMVEADRVERALVEADLADHLGPAVKAIRRESRALQRRLEWCLKELRTPPPKHQVQLAYLPKFDQPSVTETQPEPEKNETNPTTALDQDETNPAPPSASLDRDPATDAEVQLATDPAATLTVPIDGRRRRIDPGAELARQRRSARRRHA